MIAIISRKSPCQMKILSKTVVSCRVRSEESSRLSKASSVIGVSTPRARTPFARSRGWLSSRCGVVRIRSNCLPAPSRASASFALGTFTISGEWLMLRPRYSSWIRP